jgi:hypothetical protein
MSTPTPLLGADRTSNARGFVLIDKYSPNSPLIP